MKTIDHQQILEITKCLFMEKGTAETSINMIAAKAGISSRTMFRNFGTKEQLINEVIRSGVARMQTVIDKLVQDDEYQKLNGCDQLLELCRCIFRYVTRHSKEFLNAEELETYLLRKQNLYMEEQYRIIYDKILQSADSARKKGLQDRTISPIYGENKRFLYLCKNVRGFIYRAAVDVHFEDWKAVGTEELEKEYLKTIEKLLIP